MATKEMKAILISVGTAFLAAASAMLTDGIKRGNYFLRYGEMLQKNGEEYRLILDYDGFGENIASKDYLTITDDLHTIISEEYQATIKEPVYEYMRRQ